MPGLPCARWGAVMLVFVLAVSLCPSRVDAARRQGDRFGIRLGAWPQNDVSGTLAQFIQFSNDPDTIYSATIEEAGQIAPFFELFGLFNISSIWWVELSAGFAQRTDVQVAGTPLEPTGAKRILFGEGRVDFLPLFLGARAVKDIGQPDRPHNLYARGGVSMLVASEQPRGIHPRIAGTVYRQGTKSAIGFLIGGGGEYYLNGRFGIVGDVAYRMSDLNYTDDGDFDLSGFWISTGVTIRVR